VFLHNIIIKTIPEADSRIENSYKLIKKLDGRRLSDEFQLMSLNVVSLFTTSSLTMRWTVLRTIGDLFLEICRRRNLSEWFNLFWILFSLFLIVLYIELQVPSYELFVVSRHRGSSYARAGG